ncbi:MAG: hypothetical protein DELT_01182 [Desulfovibrio sp.]
MSLRITKPGTGERQSFSIPAETADQGLTLGFSTSGVTVERVGNDLVFRFEDGAESRVTNFFVTEGKELPVFILEDGTQVSSADVLKQLNDAIDIETAAGPGAGSRPGSGGAGDYADDAGSLIDGVGRLGAAGPLGQWGYGLGESETVTSAVNLGLTNISSTLYPINENMFAPTNAWDNGGILRVGFVSASDPEGQPITYSLSPAVQYATMTTDDGSMLTLGTYRIDPVTGEIFIDLEDFTTYPLGTGAAAQAAAETLANSLRVNAGYALSQVNVSITDGANVSTLQVNPVVTGDNDTPTLLGDTDAFTEAGYEAALGASTLTGALVGTDADYGETAQLVYTTTGTATCVSTNNATANASPSISDYGTFTLNTDGTWSFVSGGATNDTRISNLREGEIVQITIPVKATDPNGAESGTQNIVITITGTNDRPVMTSLTTDLEATFAELDYEAGTVGQTVNGTLYATDDDLGDEVRFYEDTVTGTTCVSTGNPDRTAALDISDFGTFSVNAVSGDWEFVAHTTPTAQALYNSLAYGETITITVPVYALDDSGNTTSNKSVNQNVVVTITGTNDRPVMTTPSANLEFTFSENQYETGPVGVTAVGTLSASDVDHGDVVKFYEDTGATCVSAGNPARGAVDISDFGTFSVDPDSGVWTFTAHTTPAAQALYNSLLPGETITITVPVYGLDDSGDALSNKSLTQNVVITITGSNEAPVIGGVSVGTAINEDHLVSATLDTWNGGDTIQVGTINATDAEGDTLTYTLTSGNATDVATITLSDGYPYEIGTYSIDSGTGVITLTLYGSIASQNGKTEAQIVEMINALKGGSGSTSAALSTVSFTVSDGTDPSTGTYNPNVAGVNDSPTVPANIAAALTEDGTTGGTLTATDVDSTVHTFTAITIYYDGTLVTAADAGLTLNADGTWSIDGTKALYQSLGAGDTADLVITYKATDDSGMTNADSNNGTLTVTVTGTNDAPGFQGQNITLTEPDAIAAWGDESQSAATVEQALNTDSASKQQVPLEFTDVDGDYPLAIEISIGGNTWTFDKLADGTIDFGAGNSYIDTDYGRLSYESGAFYYTVRNKADMLNDTDHTDTFAVKVTDAQSSVSNGSFTVTIEAENDAPVFFGNQNYGTGYDPSQPLVLAPYIEQTRTVQGQLRLGDIDSTDADLGFVIVDGGVAYQGTATTYNGLDGFEFTLPHGTLTIYWDPASTNGTFPADGGAWHYTYSLSESYIVANKLKNVELNMEIVACDPEFNPADYNPAAPDALTDSANLRVEATLYDVVNGSTAPVPDFMTVDTTGVTDFNGKGVLTEYNVLSNDLDSTKQAADAPTSEAYIFKVNGVDLDQTDGKGNYAEGTTEYGTWKLYEDGSFEFTVNTSSPAFIALGGSPAVIEIPYTVSDTATSQSSTVTATSYIRVTVNGENDSPMSLDPSYAVTDTWGTTEALNAALGIISIPAGSLATDVDAGDTLYYTFKDGSGNDLTPVPSASYAFDPTAYGLNPDFVFNPYDDPAVDATNPYTQTVATQAGDQIYDYGVGWLVMHTDGSFDFVVNKLHPDVIALKEGESLKLDIDYIVGDRSSDTNPDYLSDSGTLTIQINGSADKLATGAIGFANMVNNANSDGSFTLTAEADGSAVYNYGYQNQTSFNASGKPIDIDGGENATSYMNSYGWAETIFNISSTNVAASLDGTPMRYTLSFNASGTGTSVTLWGKDADTGEIVRLGTLGITSSTSLYYSPIDNKGGMSALNGNFTEFYTNSSGTTPLTIYAVSSDGNGTATPVDFEFSMNFVNDSPTITGVRAEISGMSLISDQVVFDDVDSKAADLTLWVQDPDNAADLIEVAGDNTVVIYSHGTLTINLDGTFTYQPAGASGTNHNIRVVVDDGESAAQNYITLEYNSGSMSTGVAIEDDFRATFSVDRVFHSMREQGNSNLANVLKNDVDYDEKAGVLNAGVYNLSYAAIRTEAAAADPKMTASFKNGTAYTEADTLFSIKAGSRFTEIAFEDASVVLNTDGSLYINANSSAYMSFYDSVTGCTFRVGMVEKGVSFQIIADTLNSASGAVNPGDPGHLTEADIKAMLNFTIEYQVRDENTGEMVTGTANVNIGEGYTQAGVYRQADSTSISLRYDTAAKTGDVDNDVSFANSGSMLVGRDNDGEDLTIVVRYRNTDGTIDTTRTTTTDVRTFTEGDRINNGTTVSYDGSDTITVPIYSWINIDTGEVATAKGSSAGTWLCVEVGTSELLLTNLGPYVQVGVDSLGKPIYGEGCGYVYGQLTDRVLYGTDSTSDPNIQKALEYFYEAMRDLTEGETGRLAFMDMNSTDGSRYTGAETSNTATWVINFSGTDVVMSSKTYSFDESDALATDGSSGTGLVTTAGTDSKNTWDTSRTNAEGWDDSAVTQVVEGAFGYLKWNGDTYEYHLYNTSYTKIGQTQPMTAAEVALIQSQITQMVNGQSKIETFEVTMVDKNGEKASGTIKVEIQGEDSVIVPDTSGLVLSTSEHVVFSNDLAEVFNIADSGTINYYLKVAGITYPLGGTSSNTIDIYVDDSNGETMGRIVFYPETGKYYFVSNGILKNGESATIDIEAWATLTNSEHASGGYTTPVVDVDLVVNGVNDAPVVYTVSGTGSLTGGTGFFDGGGVSWTDVDNPYLDGTVAYEHNGTTASAINPPEGGVYDYGVQGDHGYLMYDSDTGTYRYTLDATSFGGDSRVIDEFTVKVTDSGHLGGDNATGETTMLIYGVNGTTVTGNDADEDLNSLYGGLNDGLSHIIRGGAGDDTVNLSGTAHENILVWKSGDEGTASDAAVDTITGFTDGLTGDALDLRNLLDGLLQESTKSVEDIISFEVVGSNTTINISDTSGNVVQSIVLDKALTVADPGGVGTYEELAQQIMLITQ